MKKDSIRTKRNLITLACVLISGFLQAYSIQTFMEPSNLVASGFTGVAMLIAAITKNTAMPLSISFLIVVLNIPVALMCFRSIGPRFTFFSCLQVIFSSLFLKICNFDPLFADEILNVVFGAVLNAFAVAISLKGNASTGGTDFIALYFSNRYGRSFWDYVFGFNAIIIIIFGYTQGWLCAGYSIIFQFISTRTIENFHTRYDRLTCQITTNRSEKILAMYTRDFQHGISCVNAYGGYSKKPFTLMTTVVSSYEVDDLLNKLKDVDPDVIVNVYKTQKFVGGFYTPPMD